MANRYQERPFPADDDFGHQADRAQPKSEGDPLAELARLIGQTDPFSNFGRDAAAARRDTHEQYVAQPEAEDDDAPSGPPPWMQRANAQGGRQPDYEQHQAAPRYSEPQAEEQHDYHEAPAFSAEDDQHYGHAHVQTDPDRYDDALYGEIPGQAQHAQGGYQEDPYYSDGYDDEAEHQAPKRRGGLTTVVVILVLAVVGTGAAFAYRNFVGHSRSGEPPVIKADTSPNKIVPPSATADASGKQIQDRMAGNTGQEKMVSREEQPVDVQDNTKAGPRVVFPPLNQNANPPSTASVSPAPKPLTGNGSMQVGGDEPRKIRTFSVRGDQDPNATPAAKQVPARTGLSPAAAAPAPAARSATSAAAPNAPMSLSPQAAQTPATPPARVAALAPQQIAPAPASAGGYVVQISSQRSEADAQASFRALQGKFPSVLGSRAPLIKRADLGEKGTYYRAMVGPFGSPDEATQFCGSLKSAGGQCVVQRN